MITPPVRVASIRRFAVVYLLCAPLLLPAPGVVAAGQATITLGTPSGDIYIGVTDNGVDRYLGIPYAQPPVGNLRFRRPVAPDYNSTISLNAQQYGPRCLQAFHADDASEDCLTLNIWRPQNIPGIVPVMVWIHGGSFILGESASYPGDGLVSKSISMGQPIIYVSLNYRLGFFGFPVGSPVIGRKATNLGLYDQRMAIEWIQDNIQYFGGDPGRVTLFGESSGAMSISYQMMYKNGEIGNAFKRVILQSGAPMSYKSANQDSKSRQKAYSMIAAKTMCDMADDSFECLRAVDVKILQQAHVASYALAADLVAYRNYPAAYGPITDPSDDFLPISARFKVTAGKYANIPMICGSNVDEGTWFVAPKATKDLSSYLATEEIACSFGVVPQVSSAVMGAYPEDPRLGSPYGTGQETFGRGTGFKRAASFIGDLLFTAPRRKFVRDAALTNHNVWSYLFAQPTNGPPEYGVAHASELPYVFGHIPVNSAVDRSVSDAMQRYWINFAVYGNPSYPGSNLPKWPTYGSKAADYNMLQIKAGNYTVIKDDFREGPVDLIQSTVLLFQ